MSDKCHFCGARNACYGRREDGASRNSCYFDACEECARKPYPQPVQFVNKENHEKNSGSHPASV